jgi:hypothetical protein
VELSETVSGYRDPESICRFSQSLLKLRYNHFDVYKGELSLQSCELAEKKSTLLRPGSITLISIYHADTLKNQ